MTMEVKRLQHKKKMKRIRNQNKLQSDIDVKEKPEFTAENKPTKTIWSWIKDKFWNKGVLKENELHNPYRKRYED